VDKAIESDGPVRNVVDKSQMIQMDRLVGKSQQPSAHNEEHRSPQHTHTRELLYIFMLAFLKIVPVLSLHVLRDEWSLSRKCQSTDAYPKKMGAAILEAPKTSFFLSGNRSPPLDLHPTP
jgi:hypothetical protein